MVHGVVLLRETLFKSPLVAAVHSSSRVRWAIPAVDRPVVEEVMAEFTRIPLIDGKTFWDLERELEWL